MKKLLFFLLIIIPTAAFSGQNRRNFNEGPGMPYTFSMKRVFSSMWKSIYYNFYSGVQAKKVAALVYKEFKTGRIHREINAIFPYLDSSIALVIGPKIAKARQLPAGSAKRLQLCEKIAHDTCYSTTIVDFFSRLFIKQ